MATKLEEQLEWLVNFLVRERLAYEGFCQYGQTMPQGEEKLFLTFRALVNTRKPYPADEEFLSVQDEVLQAIIARDGIVDAAGLEPASLDSRLSLWQGDITRLKVDAIVNAANSGMTGCWRALHYCIDNAIHTYAGVQLRAECQRLMEEQGYAEPTGQAKITPAYNLPATYVVHTVGPISQGVVTPVYRQQLESCYTSCLDAAAGVGATSIAFCCISTGVFGFPAQDAAEIAVRTVHAWLDAHANVPMQVVFNVYGDSDLAIYQQLLA